MTETLVLSGESATVWRRRNVRAVTWRESGTFDRGGDDGTRRASNGQIHVE